MCDSFEKSFSFYSFIALLFISMPLFSSYAVDSAFKNAGKILLKGGAGVSASDGRLVNFLPNVSAQLSNTELINVGFGLNASAAFFLNDYIAISAEAGLESYRNSKSTLDSIQQSQRALSVDLTTNSQIIDTSLSTTTTYGSIYHLPFSLLAQFYIVSFGAIRPYLGLGYQYNVLLTDSSFFSINSKFGMVAQFGVDVIMEDDVIYFLQLERSFLDPTINYVSSTNKATSSLNLEPFTFSFGVGFQF